MSTIKYARNKEIPADLSFLCLDDQDTIRNMMMTEVKNMGFTGGIHGAANIAQAINILKSEKVDFIISDWHLEESHTGLDFLKKVRESAKFAKTPFLMCTTANEIAKILDAVEAGANGYLVKPWQTEEFKEKVFEAWEACNE